MINKSDIKIIGFDADDTLWINEPYFQDTEKLFCDLLSGYMPPEQASQELLKTEMKNIDLYGYGAKSFILSMIETAIHISNNQVSPENITKIISFGKELLSKPIVLLDGVKQVLEHLHQNGMKLVVASKGDLLDQERKLSKSNIGKYFHHVEIMSDKKESDYLKLLSHLEINPESFLMIGNSMKSDIIPVLNIGASAIYVPYHTTWQYEKAENAGDHPTNFVEVEQISDVQKILSIY